MQETADLIAGLDLVISVDTAVAHLAGAMGKPVWLLLAGHAWDWQFPRHHPDLWYPSVRAFIQARPGDWAAVVDCVEGSLSSLPEVRARGEVGIEI
jgi:ADP-heptose:LPS heptosyltransferase